MRVSGSEWKERQLSLLLFCDKIMPEMRKEADALRIAMCDDDRAFLSCAGEWISRWGQGKNAFSVQLFSDGDALLTSHSIQPFDIIFLDMVMPLLSGMDTARELRQYDQNVKLVFLTASEEFAVESYTVKASNYLLKPVTEEALNACLEELSRSLQVQVPYLSVRSGGAVHRVPVHAIEYVEAQNKHVLFVLTDGQVLRSTEPLYVYEPKLTVAEGFFKCSRSYIVNIHQIGSYTLKEVKMRSGSRIPISRNCHREFENTYFSVIFGEAAR